MSLTPRRVVDFRKHRLQSTGTRIETVVVADGIHHIAEIPQIGQQPNSTTGASPRLSLNFIANTDV